VEDKELRSALWPRVCSESERSLEHEFLELVCSQLAGELWTQRCYNLDGDDRRLCKSVENSCLMKIRSQEDMGKLM
jgi:hypothetical protein